MASPNIGGEWLPVPAEQDSASLQTTPGQQLCIRAAHVSADGNLSEWKYITHDVEGKHVQDTPPAGIRVAGAQGQIAVRYDPPPIEDYDYIQIAVGRTQGPSEAAVVYEGRDQRWVSRQVYQPNQRLYVFLRGLDTSRNPSDWTDAIAVTPQTLSDSGATVLHAYAGEPRAAAELGDLHVVLSSGVLWAYGTNGWWETGINVHASGAVDYRIAVSGVFVASGQVPTPGQLGIPIGPEIPPGSTASGRDGRTWLWSLGGQRFFLSGDVTPQIPAPVSLPDVEVNRTPAGCGRIFYISEWPPLDIPDFREGIEGEARPDYDIAVTADGTIGDNVNGTWIQRPVRLKPFRQAGQVIVRSDTPGEWTWLDQEPVKLGAGNEYGDSWWIVVSLNQGADATGAGYYGQTYIRNFRSRRWDAHYALCQATAEPAAPRDLSVTGTDAADQVRVTLAWRAPNSPTAPGLYRYRLFEKPQFDSDGRRILLMSGTTTFRSISEIHAIDPPLRYYLEVRAEYADGNSRWARTEGLLGLSCVRDPTPLPPDIFFTTTRSSGASRLPEADYNGVAGASAASELRTNLGYVRWQYGGSGTRPRYIAIYGEQILIFLPGETRPIGPAAEAIAGPRLQDPETGQYPTIINASNAQLVGALLGLSDLPRTFPGLRMVYGMRAISQCGVGTYRWSPMVIKDYLNQLTQSDSDFYAAPLSDSAITEITPPGTAAGTHHFRIRPTTPPTLGTLDIQHQYFIRGWQKDRFGSPGRSLNRRWNAAGTTSLTSGGNLPHTGFYRRRTINSGSAYTLVVTGIPTDYDGWYSLSVREVQTVRGTEEGRRDDYTPWRSIRFQGTGSFVIPPAPTVGAPVGLGGNASAQACTTWEFSWTPPVANPALNVLPPTGYTWSIMGATLRAGASLGSRISVPTLNTGQHTITVLAVNETANRAIASAAATFVFTVAEDCPCVILPPENGRQITSGVAGVAIVQFDRPARGDAPTAYPWTLTGPSNNPDSASSERTGSANPTASGGVVRVPNLPRGLYVLAVKSTGCDPPVNSMASLTVNVDVITTPPDQPFPPRNLFVREGAARSTWESSWSPPGAGPTPTAYEYKIEGQTFQTARSTEDLSAVHPNLNAGAHVVSVRSLLTGSSPSRWVTRPFTVRAEGCNPVNSLEESVGGTRSAPIWNARKLFWAAPVGGMAATHYIWELLDNAGTRIRNGSTPDAATRRVDLFNLDEGTFTFSVRTNCADGPSEAKTIGFTAECPPPEPPERLAAVGTGLADDQTWTVTWAAPTTGSDPLGFIWELTGPESRNDTESPSTLSLSFDDLPKGHYLFAIRTSGDCEKESTKVSLGFEVGRVTSCNPPRLLRKEEGRIWSTYTVYWLAPLAGDNPIRYDWRLEGPTQQSGRVTPSATENLSGQVTVDNLIPGNYDFRVKSVCNLSPTPPDTGESTETAIKITVVRRAPGNPRNVRVEGVTATIVDETNPCPPEPSWVAAWDAPASGTAPSNYDWELYKANVRVQPPATAATPNVLPALTTRAVLGRLTPDNYRFQVRSRSGTQASGWEGYGFLVPVQTLNPPVLDTANSTEVAGAESWTITWNPNPCGLRPTGYAWRWRERGAAADTGNGTTGTAQANRRATLTGGEAGKTYEFFVKATAGIRESSEARYELVWGLTTAVNPPEDLDVRRRNVFGSDCRFFWNAPSSGTTPARYNWTLTGPGPTQSGSQTATRIDFSGLATGVYSFAVRSDIRQNPSLQPAQTGVNVSTFATIGHIVSTGDDSPGEISIVETETALTPNGGSSINRYATWQPSADPAVTGYQWAGTWTQLPISGSTGALARRVDLNHLPVGTHTITVWSVKNASRSGSRTKQFTIREQGVEPPEGMTVVGTDISDVGSASSWEWTVNWRPPTSGKAPTGYRIDLYESGDTASPQDTGTPTATRRSHKFTGLADGDYEVHGHTVAGTVESEEVVVTFTQPPEVALNPPEGLAISAGMGAAWQTANASWSHPSSGETPDGYSFTLSGPKQESGESSSTSHSFTALPAGSYTLELRSTKSGRTPSEPVSATFIISEPLPGAVTDLTCRAGSSRTQKTISWTAPTGTTQADEYDIRTTGATRITRTVQDTTLTLDLSTGRTTVRVTAVANASGGGGTKLYSEEASVECVVEPAPCAIPKNVTVEASPANRLNWTARWESPEGDDQNPTGYEWTLTGAIERSGKTGALVRTVLLNNLKTGDYEFGVRTVAAGCKSDYVNVEFSIEPEPVNPPTNLAVTQDEDDTPPRDVTLTWTAPTEGLTPSGYLVRLTGVSNVAETSVSGASHTFSQLAEGSYTAYVRSVRDSQRGTEEASVGFDVETRAVLPGEPQGLSHSLSTDGTSVTYTWSEPSEGTPITGYSWTQSGGPDASGTEDSGGTTVQQSGLKVGKTYTFSVAATNAVGTGPAATITFTAERQKQRPNAVENLKHELAITTAGLVGGDGGSRVDVLISWDAPSEGDPPTHYTATLGSKSSPNIEGTQFNFTDIGTGAKTACVVAHNDVGASEQKCVSFDAVDCFPPNPVSNLTSTLEGTGFQLVSTTRVRWTASAVDEQHEAATSYRIVVKQGTAGATERTVTGSTTSALMQISQPSGLEVVLERPEVRTTVTAINDCGESSPTTVQISDSRGGPPNPPTGCYISTAGRGVDFSWQPPSEGTPPEYYVVSVHDLLAGDSADGRTDDTNIQVSFDDPSSSKSIIGYVWAVNEYGYSEPCSTTVTEYVGDDPDPSGPFDRQLPTIPAPPVEVVTSKVIFL